MVSDAVRTEEIVVAEVSEEALRSQQEAIEAARIASEAQQVPSLPACSPACLCVYMHACACARFIGYSAQGTCEKGTPPAHMLSPCGSVPCCVPTWVVFMWHCGNLAVWWGAVVGCCDPGPV